MGCRLLQHFWSGVQAKFSSSVSEAKVVDATELRGLQLERRSNQPNKYLPFRQRQTEKSFVEKVDSLSGGKLRRKQEQDAKSKERAAAGIGPPISVATATASQSAPAASMVDDMDME